MPTTFAGLLVFVAMLLPGFLYITIYTSDRPRRRRTAVEDTAVIVFGSLLAEGVTAVLYGLLASSFPKITAPSLNMLARKPQEHLVWLGGLLAISCGLAALAGVVMRRRRVHPAVMSSWWTLFHEWQGSENYSSTRIQCELDDGSCVTGVLGDWNTIEEDSPDRDIILGSPITYRPPGDCTYHPHPVSAVSISARRIVAMFVAYVDDKSSTSAEVEEEVEAAGVEEPSSGRSQVVGPAAPDPAGRPSAE